MNRATAKSLLSDWAAWRTGKVELEEITNLYPKSILTALNECRSYKPLCFKLKTNAQETRPQGRSIPLYDGPIRKKCDILVVDDAVSEYSADSSELTLCVEYYSGTDQTILAKQFSVTTKTVRNRINALADWVSDYFSRI